MFVDLEYLNEATKVTMTFGRMNPISIGHEKLADKVISIARSKSSEPRIYLSHTQNARKDPLNYNQKLKYARDAFGKIVKTSTDRNIVQLLKSLQKEGVKEVTMVVGSDRVSNFRTFLNNQILDLVRYNRSYNNCHQVKTEIFFFQMDRLNKYLLNHVFY